MVLKIDRAARVFALLAALILLPAAPASAGPSSAAEFKVPVEYYKLPNGLRVALSPDHTSPTICVGVYYRIGFRIEPRDRTGFAHLFEHMMFKGSDNVGPGEFCASAELANNAVSTAKSLIMLTPLVSGR